MIKPIIAYAIVKKKNPKILINEVYPDTDIWEIFKGKDEQLIKVTITPWVNPKKGVQKKLKKRS